MDLPKKPEFLKYFPSVTTQQWEEKIHEDLKGADYEKRLIWNTPENIKVKPYYRAEDLASLPHTHSLPASPPFVRGNRVADNNWEIRQDIPETDPAAASKMALDALDRGAESLGFDLSAISELSELKTMLHGIDPAKNPLHLMHARSFSGLSAWLCEMDAHTSWNGSFAFDPLSDLLRFGKSAQTDEDMFDEAEKLIRTGLGQLPGFRMISIDAAAVHNAGGTLVQELGIALAQAAAYFNALTDRGLTIDEISRRMQLNLAVGSDYFLEIAKFRAARLLWHKLVSYYEPAAETSGQIFIHARSSSWNKSMYDAYVNLLRTTTEAMSAAIAGVDSLSLETFDATYRKPENFSLRLARNQQIILKHEAYFNKVVDPAAGSYYIEQLTHSMFQAAWDVFLDIDEKGGFAETARSGYLVDLIAQSCQKRDMDIAMRRKVFVGTNQYPDASERMLGKIQPTSRPEDIGLLRPYRGTRAFEAIRLAVENHEKHGLPAPSVYLMCWGNLAMRKARAGFSANFFGIAGYKVTEGPVPPSLEEATRAALDARAQIIVLCSSDDEYESMIPAVEAIRAGDPHCQIVVAGGPKESMDALRQAGVSDFISLRTNVLESLRSFNERLGIQG